VKVAFMDLKKQDAKVSKQIESSVKKAIAKGSFILGPDVKIFEERFAKYCGVRYAVGVANGTESLFLSLLALGIGANDEVITTANTYIATALAISFTGARPVLVDADPITYNIDVDKIEKAITKKTKAIIPVHLYGQPCDMDSVRKIARRHGLKIIEDASQAHGAKYKGKKVGRFSDIGAFSLYPGKNLGAYGDAGVAVTNNSKIYKKLLLLRDYGRKSKYEHMIKGYNSRLDSIQAAILNIKLNELDEWNNKRRLNAKIYNKLFTRSKANVITPLEAPYAKHVYHQYVVRVPRRNHVIKELSKRGIKVLVHYPIPLHLQGAYRDSGYKKGKFPVAEKLCREVISLPIYPGLTKIEIEYVISQLTDIVGS